jgi:MoxR-like ATPase
MDAAHNQADTQPTPREKLLALERAVSERVFEREPHIRGFTVGLIASAHVLFLGPKGCAKSALARLLCDLVAWNGVPDGQNPYFRTQLRVDSTTDELYGPVSNEGFEKDTFRRNTTGMVPEAKVALLEELYVAGSVLKSLLTIMNEGLFKNGTEPEKPVPLRLLVASSNDLPADRDQNLDAFHDRFLLRYEVGYLKERKNVRRMMERANSGEDGGANSTPVSPILAEDDLDRAVEEARKVDVSPVFDAIDEILADLADREILPSDRRRASLVSLVKAQAYLNGRKSAVRGDLDILAHALWEDPDQIKDVARTVLKRANPHAARAQDLFDAAQDSYDNAMKAHRAAKANDDEESGEVETTAGLNAITALKNAARRLFELREAAKDAGADPSPIAALLEKTADMTEEVNQKCLKI